MVRCGPIGVELCISIVLTVWCLLLESSLSPALELLPSWKSDPPSPLVLDSILHYPTRDSA